METNSPNSKTGTNFFRTCFNGVNALAGIGILSIPYALSQGGWLSMIFLIVIAAICCYTGILLQLCMDTSSLIKTYPDIGAIAFGQKGRIIVSMIMYLELYLVATEFLILEGDNLEKLFPYTNFNIPKLKIETKQTFVLIGALVILPTTWLKSLNLLAYVSLGGVLASLIVVISVVWTGTIDEVGFHQRGDLFITSGIPTAVSLFAFCYSGHACFPTIYTAMKDKAQYPKVLILTFLLCTLNYGSMAIVGYLMYGHDLESQVTLNLPSRNVSTKIALYTTIITPFVKYSLVITPIANAIEDWFHIRKNIIISIMIRTCIVVSTIVVALTRPFFGYIVALTSSFLCSTATMILPGLCYLKIFKRSYEKYELELILIVTIVLLGFGIAIVGTYASLQQIVHNI